MDTLKVLFPVSGAETYVFIPPLVSFVISFFTSMSGVSGAFLLLPFQMSFLHYTNPSVSATNLVFNIVAIPSGVYRYIREKRMAWPLALMLIMGSIPGVAIGFVIRVTFLPEPRVFKLFVGCVLLYLSYRLFQDMRNRHVSGSRSIEKKHFEQKKQNEGLLASGFSSSAVVKISSFSMRKTEYEFWGETFSFNTLLVFLLSFLMGIIGGAYGIGGGALIAPIIVTLFKLPVHTIAGATLMATFLTSVSGVAFYSLLPASTGFQRSPDWLLGLLFGAGGFAGMYFGARCQKYFPQRVIMFLLFLVISFVALTYVMQFFI